MSEVKPTPSGQPRDEWLCGYAAAIAAVRRLHHEDGIVADVIQSDGLSVEKFESAGVEDFDMREIKAAIGRRGYR